MLILMVTAANKDDKDYDNKDTDTDNKQDNDVNNQFIHFFFFYTGLCTTDTNNTVRNMNELPA